MRITSMRDASIAKTINAPPIATHICTLAASPITISIMPRIMNIPNLNKAEKKPESATNSLKCFIFFS